MACNNECTSTGLAILPVRYAVVPKPISSSLPGWAQDPTITDIELENDEQYALRALRQGYLYLFYEKGALGIQYWQCFSIAQDGSLWLQYSATHPLEITSTACYSQKHDGSMVEFFCIGSPEKCGDVWLAYSQFKWSNTTLDRYKNDQSARSQRMQKIQPAVWAKNPTGKGVTIATADSLKAVLDYQDIAFSGLMPDQQSEAKHTLSSAPNLTQTGSPTNKYSVNQTLLNSWSTLYPWSVGRRGKHSVTAEKMKSRCGEGCSPMLIPLWDAVGIAHELNGWGMDVLGRQAQFALERDLDLKTHRDLELIQALLSDAAQNKLDRLRTRMGEGKFYANPETSAFRRTALRRRYQDQPELLQQAMSDCDLLEQWGAENVDEDYANELIRMPMEPLAQHRQQVARLKQQVQQEMAARESGYQKAGDRQRAKSWEPYAALLDTARREDFVECYQQLCTDIATIYEQRSGSLLNWLIAPLFITTLEDFHSEEFNDGINYQSIVTKAICGIGNTPRGQALIESWRDGLSAADCTNLLWRAVAANDPAIINELDLLLQQAKSKKDDHSPIIPTTLALALSQAGNLKKYTSFYQKASKELAKALPDDAHWVDRQLYQMDGFMSSVGDRIFNLKNFGGKLDSFNEMVFKMIFSLRAGVPPEHVTNLLNAQLTEGAAYRASLLQEIKASKGFMEVNQEKMAKYQKITKTWNDFSGKEEGSAAIKNSRIGLVMLFFNALDFGYLYSQTKGDIKSQATLLASGMTMVYQVSDIVLPALEKGESAGARTIGLVKGLGAFMGGAASAISTIIDLNQFNKEIEKNRFGFVCFYTLKMGADGLGTVKYVGMFLGAVGLTGSAENITKLLAFRILGVRVLAIFLTWEFSAILIFLQVIISWFSDNELQVWCRQCYFGSEPLYLGYSEQAERLNTAIKEIL
ncbi:T6SS effector BTH_I2691 family protein [Chimaeribacter californicus]|nr:T6SS effector BTH_I2691 family protein [Chimaeribacter californicus]